MAIGYHKLNTSAARARKTHRETIEDAHTISQRFVDIKPGETVNHSKFGVGVVIEGGMADSALIVDFDGRIKKLMAAFVEVV